jgi:hypothetical protein
MGDETKKTEVERGNTDPLRGPLAPSTAERVERRPADVAEMPTRSELERRDPSPEGDEPTARPSN